MICFTNKFIGFIKIIYTYHFYFLYSIPQNFILLLFVFLYFSVIFFFVIRNFHLNRNILLTIIKYPFNSILQCFKVLFPVIFIFLNPQLFPLLCHFILIFFKDRIYFLPYEIFCLLRRKSCVIC